LLRGRFTSLRLALARVKKNAGSAGRKAVVTRKRRPTFRVR